ncbi:3-oxoacyl-[acyl-carrier-protein] reductase [Chloroflexota bacterium]
MELKGRVAVVTGSGQGIGLAIAQRLAADGASVVISDLGSSPTAAAAADEIASGGGTSSAIFADVTVPEEVSALVEQTLSTFGRIDILVNNAGITRDDLLMRMSEDDWDRVLATNLKGAFLCTRAALRPMIKQRWGRVINIASVIGIIGNSGQANYAAAKAGLVALTKTTAKEAASRGITANAIAPGFIDTEMTRKLKPGLKEEILKLIPLGCFGLPDDVAQAVSFLASERARYITGQVIKVDGGMVTA